MENTSILIGRPKRIPPCGGAASPKGCALWRKVFTMEEAAEKCGINRSTLTRFALVGDIVTNLIGERRLVDEYNLARFIDQDVSAATEEIAGAPSQSEGLIAPVAYPHGGICAKKGNEQLYVCPLSLTVKEAATAVRIHWGSLGKFVATGELKSRKTGRSRRVSAYELWVFFDNQASGKDGYRKEAC